MSRVDRTSLVAGLVLVVLGVVFLLDRTGSLDLRFGGLWPLLTAAAGAILLAAGLDDRRRHRP
ncbi:MAG: hypothetical protein JWP18_403 [Solirubrobacterales bacterium]|jgi:hypothetical protein|nr:hypothetical protein [Solirubrobacterales bacterium]